MLASGREEMVARAVRSFQAQTYRNKRLLILDNGRPRIQASLPGNAAYVTADPASIGVLRNVANKFAGQLTGADIIAHWDSDDWSHPNRIAEQVALLQSSGAECVGYNEMLFWNTPDAVSRREILVDAKNIRQEGYDQHGLPVMVRKARPFDVNVNLEGEAWLYRSQLPNYAIGTSMMYWRGTWERNPFPDRSEGCDDLYWHTGDRVKITSVSALLHQVCEKIEIPPSSDDQRSWKKYVAGPISRESRMIASIHGGNTCAEIKPGVEWTRVPDWDEYCRREMKL